MEDSWFCIEEDSISSHNSSVYSDKIDSDIEAELYSVIHHQENLYSNNNANVESTHADSSDVATSVPNISVNNVHRDNWITETSFLKSFTSDSRYERNELVKKSGEDNELNAQVTSTPLKRKSGDNFVNEDSEDSVRIVEYSDNAKSKSTEGKLSTDRKKNKRFKNNSPNRVNSFKGNDGIISSSDSDSIIWTEQDSSDKYNLEMNLQSIADTIIVSESSDDSLTFSSPISRKELRLNNQSLPNIKIGENSRDPWYINNEDLHRSKRKTGRYHEQITMQCSNCNEKDHLAKSCPVPKVIKCVICGGSHLMAKCKNRMCSRCQGTGHDSRRCWKLPSIHCHHCRMNGHFTKYCPDIWRRYHLTTESTGIVQGRQIKQDRNLYCFNCGWPGHFGPECHERNSRSPATWPCVISYNNPEDLLMNRLSKLTDVNHNFRTNDHFNPRNQLNKSQNNMDSYHNKQLNRAQNNMNQHKKKQWNGPNNVDSHYSKQSNKAQNNMNQNERNQLYLSPKRKHAAKGARNVTVEKDFPRTPKSAQKECIRDPMPDVAVSIENRRLKRWRQRQRRALKRRSKGDNSLHEVM